MSKHRPPQPFPDYTPATTVGPQVVRTLTADAGLEAKTMAGIIDEDGQRLRVFRQSTMDHDHLSCEVYGLETGRWQLRRKDRVKYEPFGPAFEPVTIDGVSVWCHSPLRPEELEAVRAVLRMRPD